MMVMWCVWLRKMLNWKICESNSSFKKSWRTTVGQLWNSITSYTHNFKEMWSNLPWLDEMTWMTRISLSFLYFLWFSDSSNEWELWVSDRVRKNCIFIFYNFHMNIYWISPPHSITTQISDQTQIAFCETCQSFNFIFYLINLFVGWIFSLL